ncbi:MAG: LPXTG cell wall anchor domain-containing protein [Actinobacteria bacterium]|nr:LPXTG cell wall anchor domain-containing protein [Actinomycetota bacterium]
MLRKLAAGTSAAVVAAGLAAAPAVAAGLSASPGDVCSDSATQTEQNGVDQTTTQGFVFGPLADVPHLQSAGPSCVTVAPAVADFSSAHRHSASPPPPGTPVPEVPSSAPPVESPGPEAPGPGESVPPAPAGPPADTSSPPSDTASPPAPPELTPSPVAPSPPPAPRSDFGGPGESVLPSTQPPAEAARLPQTASETRPLTAAGGGSLIAAGLAWIGGARRRRKRPARPAED